MRGKAPSRSLRFRMSTPLPPKIPQVLEIKGQLSFAYLPINSPIPLPLMYAPENSREQISASLALANITPTPG